MEEQRPPTRRAEDRWREQIEKKVDAVAVRVDEIRDWLIGEPESSALGRQLLSRAKQNRRDIDLHEGRINNLEQWRDEWRGSWRLVLGIGVVLGTIGAFFGLLSYIGH